VHFAQVQPDIGIARKEVRQPGQQKIARLSAVDIDSQEARRLGATEACFGILHVSYQSDAPLIESLSVQSWTDHACRSLQEPYAQPLLQQLNRIGDGGAGQA
jgi:hypothetical protein